MRLKLFRLKQKMKDRLHVIMSIILFIEVPHLLVTGAIMLFTGGGFLDAYLFAITIAGYYILTMVAALILIAVAID